MARSGLLRHPLHALATLGVLAAVAVPPDPATVAHDAGVPPNLRAISCATPLRCVAVGGTTAPEAVGTTDGGVTWSSLRVPDVTTGLVAVSCPTAARCIAEGPDAADHAASGYVATADGGATWVAVHGSVRVDAPTCTTASTCAEIDGTTLLRSTTGFPWSSPDPHWLPVPATGWSGINYLSCDARAQCFVLGTIEAGQRFQLGEVTGRGIIAFALLPALDDAWTPPYPQVASCTSTSACTALVFPLGPARVVTTSDGGARWRFHALPAALRSSSALECVRAGTCVLVGPDQPVAVTRDGGASWSMPRVPSGPDVTPAVSCRGATCFALDGDAVLVSADDLRAWTWRRVP